MTDISSWSTTAADNNAAAPDGFPDGMLPSALNNTAREMMRAMRKHWDEQKAKAHCEPYDSGWIPMEDFSASLGFEPDAVSLIIAFKEDFFGNPGGSITDWRNLIYFRDGFATKRYTMRLRKDLTPYIEGSVVGVTFQKETVNELEGNSFLEMRLRAWG